MEKTALDTNPNVETDVKPVGRVNDLGHILTNEDLDAAQAHHENLPKEARKHFIQTVAHKAGLRPDPGMYKGPPITVPAVPSDQDTRDLQLGMQEIASQAALNKLSTGKPTAPPLPPYQPGSMQKAGQTPPSGPPPLGGPTPGGPGGPMPPGLNPALGGLAPMPNPEKT